MIRNSSSCSDADDAAALGRGECVSCCLCGVRAGALSRKSIDKVPVVAASGGGDLTEPGAGMITGQEMG